MIRIEKVERNGRVVWRLQGRLTGTDGDYFAQELTAFFREHPGECLDVDLREVRFMSDGAIEALKALQGAVRVIACNGFLGQLLEAEGVALLLLEAEGLSRPVLPGNGAGGAKAPP